MVDIYLEDLDSHFKAVAGPYRVTEAEILEFGRRFDTRPFHTDPDAAKNSVFGGLVAPGCLIFAIRAALVNQLDRRPVYLAGLGLEQMDIPNPARPGDDLFLTVSCLEWRESRSRTDAGVVRFANTLTNQKGETVLSMIAKVLVARRLALKA